MSFGITSQRILWAVANNETKLDLSEAISPVQLALRAKPQHLPVT